MSEQVTDEVERKRPGPRRKKGAPSGPAAVQRAVLDAAIKLFVQHGVASVSLRDIAADADVELALIRRYLGSRTDLISAVFDDVSNSLAIELTERPLQQISFDQYSTMGRWTVVLLHLVMSGADINAAVEHVNPIQTLADVFVDHFGADPVGARVRAAQVAALALGWRLFERYLIVAGDLGALGPEVLHDEVTALNRHIGGIPWPLTDQ